MAETIKKRKIKVLGMTCEGCERTINDALSKMAGIKAVRADKSGKVYVEYDLMEIRLKDIEEKIIDLGYKLPHSFLHNLKMGFIHDKEKNEYDNLNSSFHSCCSDPKARLHDH